MFCPKCGSELPEGAIHCNQCGAKVVDESDFCQKCDTPVENEDVYSGAPVNDNPNEQSFQQSEVYGNEGDSVNVIKLKKSHKTLKIILGCVGGAIVLFIILGLLFGGKSSSKNDQEILAVQNGELIGLDYIKMKDVVENYWKGGKWDCFNGETDSGNEAKIVEYRKDGEGLIQFNVDDEKQFSIIHFKDESHPIESSKLMEIDIGAGNPDDLKTCINSLYSKYGYDILTMKNIDLADYVSKDPSELTKATNTIMTSDDMMTDQLHQLTLSVMDGAFSMVGIKGNKDYSPSFAGVCIGDTDYEDKLVNRSYIKVTGDDGLTYYLDESTGAGVNVEVDAQSRVNNLIWVNKLSDYTTWQTEDAEQVTTPTPVPQVSDSESNLEDYIYPDSATRLLTEDDLVHRNPDILRLAKNEIYARRGRKFKDSTIQAYFDGKSWYQGTIAPEDFDESMLSDIEKQNVQFLDNASSTGSQSLEISNNDFRTVARYLEGTYIKDLTSEQYNELTINENHDDYLVDCPNGDTIGTFVLMYYMETKGDRYEGKVIKKSDDTFDLYWDTAHGGATYIGTITVDQVGYSVVYSGSQIDDETNGLYTM